ncbi:hypothetical protein OSTOST_12669, partial [Ostertagia ostertagi]
MVNMDAVRAYLAATFPTLPSEIKDYVSCILEANVNKLLTLEDVVEAVGAHIQSHVQGSCNDLLNRTCLQLLRLLHGENSSKVEKHPVTTEKLDQGVDMAAENQSSAGMERVSKVQAMDVPTTANKEELGKVGVRAEQKIEQRFAEAVAQTKEPRSSATSSQIWLQERQEERRTSFYTRSSVKSKGIIRLRCNRAGKYTKSTETRVTHSKRDVLHCSCFMDVKLEDDGRVNVKGCFGHIGHKVDVALLRLTPSQQIFLRGLLEEFSHDYIIKRLRKDYPTSRLGFVNKSDLWSIVNKYGLRPGYRHKDDMQSLKIREEENNPNDGIRIFEMPENPTGRGFCIIIITPEQVKWLRDFSNRGVSIDDIHNATRYNLKLATLMVLNERDRDDEFIRCGEAIPRGQKVFPEFNPAQIVTDEAPCFFNGFHSVFPDSHAQLHYCRWHIGKTWERSANKYVELRVRTRVKRMMKDLLIIRDLSSFQHRFAELLVYLREEGRTPTWGSFSNPNAIMDTTMISEHWHLRLKSEFLNRNANSRADYLVDLLIRAVEELSQSDQLKRSVRQCVVKARRRLANSSYRSQQSAICHRLALKKFRGHSEKIKRLGNEKWEVYSKSAEIFVVRRIRDCECNDAENENVHCPLCGICPYSWSCSCKDNRAGISCVHRHAIMLFHQLTNKRTPLRTLQTDAFPDPPPHEEAGPQEGSKRVSVSPPVEVDGAQVRKEERSQLRDSINMKLAVLHTKVNALVNTDTDEAKEMLSTIENLIDRASKTGQITTPGIAIRPELTKRGAKPKQSKVQLYTRKQARRARDRLSPDSD